MPAKALLLYNPAARHAPGPSALATLRRCLERGGFAVDAAVSETPGDLSRLASLAEAGGFERVVVCGGDGSVREAAQGLKGSPVPLAIIPMGTANILSREIGLDAGRLFDCAMTACKGKARPVTLGEVEGGGVFTFCASTGMDSWAVKTVDLKMKRETGAWAYVHAGMMGLLEREIPLFQIDLPSGRKFIAQQVFALNAGHYGLGSLVLSRDASLQSPFIRVIALAPPLIARLPVVATRITRRGIEGGKGVFWEDADSFRIGCESSFPVQADGDEAGSAPCTVKALPAALNLVFPE